MRLLKKIAMWLLGILLLLVLLNYGVSWWITKNLPSIIHKEKDFPYNVSYKDLDLSIINGSFTMHDVYLAPKDSTLAALKQGAFGEIKTINVQHFNLWALLREERIKVKRIVIDSPDIILYEKDKKYNVEDDVSKPFRNIVNTGSLEVRNGKFRMFDNKLNPLIKSANINLEINNIKLDSAIVESNIPVRYTDYKFKCDSLFYKIDNVYNIVAQNVHSTESTITVNNLKLIPKYNRAQYTRSLKKEKDLFTVEVKKLNLPKVEWGYYRDTLFVHAPRLELDNLAANIYRNKEVADDPSRKKLYSEALRDLDFDLKIDRLIMRNSYIQYEEQVDFSKPPAIVSFSKFYANITNVYSAVNKKKIPTTVSNVQCLFMNVSPLQVTWTFNVPDASDSFTIKGHLQNLQSRNLNKLSLPLMNIASDSDIKEVKFTINGNNNFATGNFAIDYDNMKVTIYRKDGKKKNKFMTAVGNLLVKNDSNDKLKQADIQVARLKDKSVFNFLWRCLQEGLKQTLLPKAVSAVLPKGGKK